MIAIAHFHEQPPFETKAKAWIETRQFSGHCTVNEVFNWAKNLKGFGGYSTANHLIQLEIKEEK